MSPHIKNQHTIDQMIATTDLLLLVQQIGIKFVTLNQNKS